MHLLIYLCAFMWSVFVAVSWAHKIVLYIVQQMEFYTYKHTYKYAHNYVHIGVYITPVSSVLLLYRLFCIVHYFCLFDCPYLWEMNYCPLLLKVTILTWVFHLETCPSIVERCEIIVVVVFWSVFYVVGRCAKIWDYSNFLF